jgi:hypothetical protein
VEELNAALYNTSPHRASGLGLGASDVGFGLLRSVRTLGVSRCGRQEKERK